MNSYYFLVKRPNAYFLKSLETEWFIWIDTILIFIRIHIGINEFPHKTSELLTSAHDYIRAPDDKLRTSIRITWYLTSHPCRIMNRNKSKDATFRTS